MWIICRSHSRGQHDLVRVSYPVDVFLGLGANLGERATQIRSAIARLPLVVGEVVSVSRFYESEPEGGADQPPYLNACVHIRTKRRPEDLLVALKGLEEWAGRQSDTHGESRTLDIDILFYGNQMIRHAGLTIPHPRIERRPFVLQPLWDIAPELVHPVSGLTVRQLLERCPVSHPLHVYPES